MKYYLLILMTVLIYVQVDGGQLLLNVKAPEFSLLDQYDKSYTIRQDEGRIVVLLASDREGSALNREWGARIGERYKNKIVIIGIADVRTVPFFLKTRVKNSFKKDKARVLLDWKGSVFTTYGFARSMSNVVVIDKKGVVRYVYCGDARRAASEKLFREIDKLLLT